MSQARGVRISNYSQTRETLTAFLERFFNQPSFICVFIQTFFPVQKTTWNTGTVEKENERPLFTQRRFVGGNDGERKYKKKFGVGLNS